MRGRTGMNLRSFNSNHVFLLLHCLLLGRKAMTNLDSVLKSRDITLPTKVHIVKAMVFSVVIYRCVIQTIKKAEHQIIDASELWCYRILLRVPWTGRRAMTNLDSVLKSRYNTLLTKLHIVKATVFSSSQVWM